MASPLPPSGQRKKRISFFFNDYVDPEARILEIGPGDGWLGAYLIHSGFHGYRRLHSEPPADIVGDIRCWRELGLAPESFDILIAFDTQGGVDFLMECFDLLAPGGQLFTICVTPGRGWWAKFRAVANQRRKGRNRTGRRADVNGLCGFELMVARNVGCFEQWSRLRKPLEDPI